MPGTLRTGDCERMEGGSGARGGELALMGDGREFRLGLRGAWPEGAWEKTTTHWPTCRRRAGLLPELHYINHLAETFWLELEEL